MTWLLQDELVALAEMEKKKLFICQAGFGKDQGEIQGFDYHLTEGEENVYVFFERLHFQTAFLLEKEEVYSALEKAVESLMQDGNRQRANNLENLLNGKLKNLNDPRLMGMCVRVIIHADSLPAE